MKKKDQENYFGNYILGLIIDAFGDLREQLESVKETLEVI